MIFETHAHYDDESFDEDRRELLLSLPDNGIGYVINVGADLAGCRETLRLTEEYPFVYGAVGVHPSETAELDDAGLAWLREQCARDKIVAVGEIGLDYHQAEPERAVQKRWFERQMETARETGLPVIIHSRDAARDTLDILHALRAEEIGGVIHCFSYTKEIAREYLDMDFYFGIGGVVTFGNAKKLREAVQYIPMDRILLETDSPYLSPEPYRGRRNSSLHLPYVAEAIAALKNIPREEVEAATAQNALRLFRKIPARG